MHHSSSVKQCLIDWQVMSKIPVGKCLRNVEQ